MGQKYVRQAIFSVLCGLGWSGFSFCQTQPRPDTLLFHWAAQSLTLRSTLMQAMEITVREHNAEALREAILKRHPISHPNLPQFPTLPTGAKPHPSRSVPDWREEIKRGKAKKQ